MTENYIPEGVCVLMPVYQSVNFRLQDVLRMTQVPVIQNHGMSVVAMSRSLLGTIALKKTKYERFVWLDADMVLTKEQLLELATETEPLVSGVYMSGQGRPCVCPEQTTVLPEEGYLPIHWAGMGCVSMSREVLAKVAEPLPQIPIFGGIYPMFADTFVNADDDQVAPDDPECVKWLTEDLSFFRRAKIAGFQPLLKCSLRVEHLKEFPLPVIPGIPFGGKDKF